MTIISKHLYTIFNGVDWVNYSDYYEFNKNVLDTHYEHEMEFLIKFGTNIYFVESNPTNRSKVINALVFEDDYNIPDDETGELVSYPFHIRINNSNYRVYNYGIFICFKPF